MNSKEYLHEQAEGLVKDLSGHLRKIIESLEIGNGCEEAECLAINTSTRCFLQGAEDLLEFINSIKLKAIVGLSISSAEPAGKEANESVLAVKKYLANINHSLPSIR